MRKQFLLAALALGTVAGYGFAKDPAPTPNPAAGAPAANDATAEGALHKYYGPNAQFHLLHSFDVNGVKVEQYSVNSAGGQSMATVTTRGDLITTGIPTSATNLTPGAQETLGLFKSPAQNVTLEHIHGYYVAVNSGANKTFVAEIDAAGRIRSIKAPEQLREDAKLNPAPAKVADQIKQVASQRFKGDQVEGVSEALHDPGYYIVGLKNAQGRGWAILNANNDVTEYRQPVTRESLPPAVQNTINNDLKGDKIVNIETGGSRLYQVTQGVGTEQITMLIAPNGSVEWISSRQPHHGSAQQGEPVTAGHHTAGSK
ncbi:MAG: hypothetical protein JWL69_5008 [Phycisphaerales bacterium]|nr:hypothetical protein [Phycisphaerales bacterium]